MEKQIRFTAIVEQSLKDRIKVQAVSEHTTITEIVKKALFDYLEKHENKGEKQ